VNISGLVGTSCPQIKRHQSGGFLIENPEFPFARFRIIEPDGYTIVLVKTIEQFFPKPFVLITVNAN